MKILHLTQGSDIWLATRLSHFTASEAPAMMGASPHMSRTELLELKKTGIAKEVDRFTQAIFDKGHALEALARPIIERRIGDELFPVTGSLEVDELPLLASFDGLNMEETIVFEHKMWNEKKAELMTKANDILPEYYWQLEQLLLVSSAGEALFVMSDGTEDNMFKMGYISSPERRAALIAGWKQFQKDLESFIPAEKVETVVALPVSELPAITYKMNGLALTSNLDVYKTAVAQLIEESETPLETDQDFADREALCKAFKKAEGKLSLMKDQVIGEVMDIDQFCNELAKLAGELGKARLKGEKLVKAQKEIIKSQIYNKAANDLSEFLDKINTNLEGVYLPAVSADFGGVMKGKRNIASLQGAVDSELANVKIQASGFELVIRDNLKTLKALGVDDRRYLFGDLQQIIMKDGGDFKLLAQSRIDAHQKKEAERLERIREEERLKAEQKAQSDMALKDVNRVIEKPEEYVKHEKFGESSIPTLADLELDKGSINKGDGYEENEIYIYLKSQTSLTTNDCYQVSALLAQGNVPFMTFNKQSQVA